MPDAKDFDGFYILPHREDDGLRLSYFDFSDDFEKGKNKGHLMGGSGAATQANVMMDWYAAGAVPDHFPRYQDDNNLSAVLTVVTTEGLILRYEYTPVPIVFEDAQYCTGSGRDIAYGALHMGANAVEAVQVVSEFMSDCGMGVDAIRLHEKKARKK